MQRNQFQLQDGFAIPGPDRPRPIHYTDWRRKPPIPPRRGKHYNVSTVGPPITALIYPPTIFFGRLLKIIWGELFIWEIRQFSIDINDYLPFSLRPTPLPTFTDHIKHQILCAKPIIWMIRRSQVQAHPVYRMADKTQLIDELLIDQKYNFVLLEDGQLVFARIPHVSPKYPYRLLSKHVGLAKGFSNVRFAGELKKADHSETLLINNNSGTYRPDEKLLPAAEAYLQRLFPHILVRGVSRK